MKQVTLPRGEAVPALGQGSWFLGDDPDTRGAEIAALQEGMDRGLRLIDTAEMYGDGRAETLVGEAIAGCRDDVFLVTKVLPSNAGRHDAVAACEASLERLNTDRIDLYLLHWQGDVVFADTLAAFERLKQDGKIRHYGCSNLDLDAFKRFYAEAGGDAIQSNQLLYNLNQRQIEYSLLAWLQNHGIATMAYSPFDRGRLTRHSGLADFARERDMSASQVALAWLMGQQGVIPIPKTADVERVTENAAALDVTLTPEDRAALDRLFAPPTGDQPLPIY